MENITAKEIKEKIKLGKKPYMIDVREQHEYVEKNNDAHHIPLDKFQSFELDEIEVDKEEEIICLCKSGKRSMLACLILEQLGYTNVKNLQGGIDAWFQIA